MPFNWINSNEYSINSLLLMDRWMLRQLLGLGDSQNFEHNSEYRKAFGIVLKYNPVISWYVSNKCPEASARVKAVIDEVSVDLSADEVRNAEILFIDEIDTMIVYLYPDDMNKLCPYIRDWDSEKLLSLVDFTDKVILDVGSGTGRLAFAAAAKAKKVYASEPADRLREFMRDKILAEKITNVVVLDGTVECIPFEDNTFDIVTSGYVLGVDYGQEIANMERVCKNGGYVIVCEGESDTKWHVREPLISLGFEHSHYLSKAGGDCYRYWKKVAK
jgi:2-polyprenyl-3-methyl-5-hydroxy-6-metoxy-1,4-benzoquinol methylase